MSENSKIEWTHHTANLWWGCTEVHAGCDNCYARVLDNRWSGNHWGKDSVRRAIKSVWKDLAKYQKAAASLGEVHRVFVGSMMDIFEKPMPLEKPINIGGNVFDNTGQLRTYFFNNFVPQSPNLQFLLLTKRPGNINRFIPESWKADPPKNVMFGTSPVDQETADKLIPQLLEVKGAKFLSVEPMLNSIDLSKWLSPCGYYCDHSPEAFSQWVQNQAEEGVDDEQITREAPFFISNRHIPEKSKIDWVIVGGESGQHKRPFNPDWARSIRTDCKETNTAFFMKQWDKIQPVPEDLMIREFPHLTFSR